MDRWLNARIKAYAVRKHIETKVEGALYGEALLKQIIEEEDLECLDVPADDPLLGNEGEYSQARYYASEGFIVVREDLSDELRNLLKAHELGHHFLHTRQITWTTDQVDPANLVLTLPYAEGRIANYSPYQLQENEATVFAIELLIPSAQLAQEFDEGKNAHELAQKFQVSNYTIMSQMANVLLAPPINFERELTKTDIPAFHWQDLDESQQNACCVSIGPTLVQAGPGTGKTRTLTSRIEWLIEEKNIRPEKILALTFSNKATEELRLRLHQTIPNIAHQVTVSTFHSFGLELLRRYSDKVELPLNFFVIDPIEAEMLLEENLVYLELEYFSDPATPERYLAELLEEISRAKEELCTPTDYLELITKVDQDTPDNQEKIKKHHEVAQVYQKHELLLKKKGGVDYGDLVFKPIQLLKLYPDILKQLQDQYQYILVDEYQDINRANCELVRLLAQEGQGLWAVGDLRQSIYRWRGASPIYFRHFNKHFPTATIYPLEINYRASKQLVDFTNKLTQYMSLSLAMPDLQSKKGQLPDSSIQIAMATEKEMEWQGIADKINQFVKQEEFNYHDIAILCRKNKQASELAQALTQLGIPCLHLGKFFFRNEIKNLLALLSLIVYKDGITWLRVTELLREPLSRSEAITFWQQIREASLLFDNSTVTLDSYGFSLSQQEDIYQILSILSTHENPNPWSILSAFLFDYGHYLRRLRLSQNLEKDQFLLAIAQLLSLAGGFRKKAFIGQDHNLVNIFIQHVNRLIKRDTNDVNLPVSEVEAVRVLTIHKAKGLEFPIVFVPNLAHQRFPGRKEYYQAVPSLVEFMREIEPDGQTLEDESCLFVAVSRAEKHLIMSRAKSYWRRLGKPVNHKKSELWGIREPAIDSKTLMSPENWEKPLQRG